MDEAASLFNPDVNGTSCLSVSGAVLEPDFGVTASASSMQQCISTNPAYENSACDPLHNGMLRMMKQPGRKIAS